MGREGGEPESGAEQQEMEPTDEQEEMEASEPLSTSGRKLGASMLEEKNIRDKDKGVRNGYALFDTSILVTLLEEVGKRTLCNSPTTVKHKIKEKMGLLHFISKKLHSEDCPWTKDVATSNLLNKEVVNGKVPYDINDLS